MRLRRTLKSGGMSDTMVDLVLNGLPSLADVDMTSKLGSQNALSILPYTEMDPQKMGNWEKVFTALGGPTVGMGGKIWSGIGDFQRGDYYKMLEKMGGSGPGNWVEGLRLATQGERTFNTDQVFSPDELGVAAPILTALGFTPEMRSKRWTKQRVLTAHEQTFDRRTSELKRAYSEAKNSGQRKDLRRLRQEWMDLQKVKKEAGFRPAPVSDLLRAPVEQKKRERQVEGGVKWDRGNRRAVGEINQAFGG